MSSPVSSEQSRAKKGPATAAGLFQLTKCLNFNCQPMSAQDYTVHVKGSSLRKITYLNAIDTNVQLIIA